MKVTTTLRDNGKVNQIVPIMQEHLGSVMNLARIKLLAFVLQFIRLGASAGNPMEREKVLKGIIWTGIGTAGCGAATLIFSLAFGMI